MTTAELARYQLRNYKPRGGGPSRPSSNSLASRLARSPWPYRLVVLLVVGGVWEWYARTAQLLLVPAFTSTLVAVKDLLLSEDTYASFWASNQALIIGFAISVSLGIVLGLGMARFRGIEGFVDPYLSILLVTPMAMIIPILIMSVGIDLPSRVILVVVFTLPVIIVNSRAGVRQVDPNLIEMATSFGARERQIWTKILMPAALPAILTGIRLGLGRGVTGMVIIELLMVAVGIGHMILNFQGHFEAARLYGTVVLVIVEALILVSVLRAVERRIAPWAHQTVLRE